MHMNINHFGMVNIAESGLERGYVAGLPYFYLFIFFLVLFGGD